MYGSLGQTSSKKELLSLPQNVPLAILVPKLQLGNAVLEALLRRPESTSAHHTAATSVESAMKGVDGLVGSRSYEIGKRSFQSVRSQAGAWNGVGRFGDLKCR